MIDVYFYIFWWLTLILKTNILKNKKKENKKCIDMYPFKSDNKKIF